MRNCFYDDAHPGQQFVVQSKQGWFTWWVIRPLKAVFVKAPKAVYNWCVNQVKAIWNDPSIYALRTKLYDNFWGTPFHRLLTCLIAGGVVGVYFWNPIAFKMAMITVCCVLIYMAFLYVTTGVAVAGADAYKTQEMSHIKERLYEVKVADAQSTIDTAKARAQANFAQRVAAQLSAKIEKEETERLIAAFEAKQLSTPELKRLLDSGELAL